MKRFAPLSAIGLVGVLAASLLSTSASAATAHADAPDTGITESVSGRFVGQARAGGVGSYFAVGSSGNTSNPIPASVHGSVGEALVAATEWTFPAIDGVGPIRGVVNGWERCLEPNPLQRYKYVYPASCNGSLAQEWAWQDIETSELSGSGLVSSGGQGGFLRQFAGMLAVGGIGLPAEGAVILPDGSAPQPDIEPLVLTDPAVGSTVRIPQPTFSGTGHPGSAIEVVEARGGVIASGVVNPQGSWTAPVSEALAAGGHAGTVRQVVDDTTVPWSLTYAAVRAITVESPALDSTVEVDRPVFSGRGEPGASVTVVDDRDGVTLVDTAVGSSGTWSQQSLRTLEERAYTATATQLFEQQRTTAPVRFTYREPTPEPGPVVDVTLESPAIGAVITTPVPVFTGRGEPGATVRVIGSWNSELGNGLVTKEGTWRVEWNKSITPGTYRGGRVVQEISGVEQSRVPYDFVMRPEAGAAPLVVTSPKVGGALLGPVPVFTGTAQPGARVEIRTQWGRVAGSVDSVDSSGTWSITWNQALLPARYVGGTVKQYIGGVEAGRVTYDFTIAKPLVVTSPTVGETISGTRPEFTGTATPGSTISIVGAWGTDLGSDVVRPDGTWSILWPTDYQPGRYAGGHVKQAVNGTVVDQFAYDFILHGSSD
jgi:hypothetical protein